MAPAEATDIQRELTDTKLSLDSDPLVGGAIGGGFDSSGSVGREGLCDAEGRFEIRGVKAVKGLTLSGAPKHLAAFKLRLDDLRPGLVKDVSIALERGANLAGLVLDGSGAGVAGAKLEVRADAVMFGMGGRLLRETTSLADGSFSLEAVAAGKARIDVTAKGFLETKTDIELIDGVPSNELVLRLDGGNVVAGKVTWTDGSAASAIDVKVSFDPAHLMGAAAFNAMRGGGGGGLTNELGEFSISGLGKGPFVVAASGRPAKTEGESGETLWTAQRAGVKPGTLDVLLALAPPSDVAGRVIDDLGAPVTQCQVSIEESSSNPWIPGDGPDDIHVENVEGTFTAESLAPGSYTAKAHFEDGPRSAPVSFNVPRAAADGPLVITLARPATVSGRVLMPDGSPAANARVQQQLGLLDLQRGSTPGNEPNCTTDAEGNFSTTALPIGALSLKATKSDCAPSESVALKLEAAGSVSGVVLQLRKGGTITGEAFGKDGKPKSDATILAQMPLLEHGQLWAKTDANGKFEYTHVAPGQWQVIMIAIDPAADVRPAAEGEDEGAKAMASMMDQMKIAMADVKEGGSVHVQLGAPAKNAVHVRGRVTSNGRGVGSVLVSFLSTDGTKPGESSPTNAMGSIKMKSSDQEGRFEVDLDHSGSYLISVQKLDMKTGAQQSVEFSRVIPDGPDYSLELELPMASISGRVSNSDGEALPGARMTLNIDGPVQGGTLAGGRYSEGHADENGDFNFDWLAPGSYTVAAGGLSVAGMLSNEEPKGRQVRDGIRVGEGERVAGVDFRLSSGCVLTGKVLDSDGKPVGEAGIFVRDEQGRPVDRISMTTSDSSGGFRQRGLSAGRYSVSARTTTQVSSEVSVVLRDGTPGEVEVRLALGTMLIVVVNDKDNQPVQVSLSVTDDRGRQVNGVFSLSDMMRAFSDGSFNAKETRIGPLAQGKYQVTAIAADGTKLARSVTLIGQSQRKITLELGN